jgi:hypothetical protein
MQDVSSGVAASSMVVTLMPPRNREDMMSNRSAEHIAMMIAWSQMMHSDSSKFGPLFNQYIAATVAAASRNKPS